jgi:hypothetical protein
LVIYFFVCSASPKLASFFVFFQPGNNMHSTFLWRHKRCTSCGELSNTLAV